MRATTCTGERLVGFDDFGGTKVGQLEDRVGADENICGEHELVCVRVCCKGSKDGCQLTFWFEISVLDAVGVQILKTA